MLKVDIIAITLDALKIGVYHENKLINTLDSSEKTSDVLPLLFEELLKKYEIETIVYTNGPGSFMAIKISYVFFKTLSITKNIKLLSADGFYFNNNAPIKSIGKLYFLKEDEGIITKKIKEPLLCDYKLPDAFIISDFSEDTTPNYCIPAV